MIKSQLYRRARRVNLEERILSEVGPWAAEIKGLIGIGVSGGQDSLCLLDAVIRIVDKSRVIAIYCDHRWSKGDDNRDHVERLCKERGINLRVFTWHDSKISEGAARDFRLECFRGATKELGLTAVLLAHTATDKMETIIYKMIRGTSSRGMVGIKPISEWNGLRIVRPLLNIWREQTGAYCEKRNLTPYKDPSNDDISFARNRIRCVLTEQFHLINSGARKHILRLGRLVSEDDTYLASIAMEAYESSLLRSGVLSTEKLVNLEAPILRRVICTFLEDLIGRCPTYEEIEHFLALISKVRQNPRTTYKSRDIRGGHQLLINRYELRPKDLDRQSC